MPRALVAHVVAVHEPPVLAAVGETCAADPDVLEKTQVLDLVQDALVIKIVRRPVRKKSGRGTLGWCEDHARAMLRGEGDVSCLSVPREEEGTA